MSGPLRILWLKTGPLHPVDTGGKIRTFNMLRELRRKHRITYLALCPEETEDSVKSEALVYSHEQLWIPWRETPKFTVPFYAELAKNFFLTRRPYAIEKYESSAMAMKIQDQDLAKKHDLIVCDFLTPAVNLLHNGQLPGTPTLLFQHNVESLIWKRTYETARGRLKRFYLRSQWQRMEAFERETCAAVDAVAGVSEQDCGLMRQDLGLKNVIGSVPTGVDIEHFSPAPASGRKPRSIAFLGSMDWMPNIDGIVWFVDEIWPALKRKFPDATLTIIGRKPTPKVQELAQRDPAIRVTGTVPDVRPFLAEAEVMVVPLRVGGGTRIKIFEAMATGIPVVSTRIGAEGLPVKHGGEILLADEPADFAQQIALLFEQETLRRSLGQNARRLVQARFSWGSVTDVFEKYCQEVAAVKRRTNL